MRVLLEAQRKPGLLSSRSDSKNEMLILYQFITRKDRVACHTEDMAKKYMTVTFNSRKVCVGRSPAAITPTPWVVELLIHLPLVDMPDQGTSGFVNLGDFSPIHSLCGGEMLPSVGVRTGFSF